MLGLKKAPAVMPAIPIKVMDQFPVKGAFVVGHISLAISPVINTVIEPNKVAISRIAPTDPPKTEFPNYAQNPIAGGTEA